jgi:hypothetical protein
LDHLNPEILQIEGGFFGTIAGDSSKVIQFGEGWVVEDIGNKRASLLACGSEDCKELAHDGLNECAWWGECLKRRLEEEVERNRGG